MMKRDALEVMGFIDSDIIDEADMYINKSITDKQVVSLRKRMLKVTSWAACLVLVFLTVAGVRVYAKPVSHIGIDVNPSLELCLNRWNYVVEVKTYNAEAREICDNLNLKHKYYANAVNELLCDDKFSSYCKDDETADLTFTIVANNCDDLQDGIKACNGYEENHGAIYFSDVNTMEKAHESNCSIGKYVAYEELKKYDPDVSVNDCADMTMHELHEMIDNHHSEGHNSDSHEDENHDSNNHGVDEYDTHNFSGANDEKITGSDCGLPDTKDGTFTNDKSEKHEHEHGHH